MIGGFGVHDAAVSVFTMPRFRCSRCGEFRNTAVGAEEGYLLSVAELTALDIVVPNLLVHVFDLGHDDIEGLLGLNFLSRLNYEIRSVERRVLVERVAQATG